MEPSKRKVGFFLRFLSSHVLYLCSYSRQSFPVKQKDFLWKRDVLKALGHFKKNRETINLLFEE